MKAWLENSEFSKFSMYLETLNYISAEISVLLLLFFYLYLQNKNLVPKILPR